MTTVSVDALTRDDFNALIEREFEQFGSVLHSSVTCPDGHGWKKVGASETRWCGNDPIQSTIHGASYFIRRTAIDTADPFQIAVEVRWFFKKRPLIGSRGRTEMVGSYDDYRCIVWCEQGRPFAGMKKSLFGKDDVLFLSSQSIEDLGAKATKAINDAFQNMKQPEAIPS